MRSLSSLQAVGPASLHLALVLLAATACGESSNDAAGGAPPTTSAATSTATGATKSGASATNTTSSTATTAGTGGAAPMTEEIHVVARTANEGGARVFSWSGSSIRTTVDGDGVDFTFEGAADIYFQIAIDGEPTEVVTSEGGTSTFEVSGLGPGQHEIELVRRNEGFFGDIGFVSATPRDGATLVPTPVRARRIELIGDSLTAGYGIEGPNATCSFSGATESAYTTYGMTAARALDADAHVIAWSGKGVFQNYGGDRNEMMPELWRRTLAQSGDMPWDFSSWVPQAVVVNLGTNDFSAPIADGDFVSAYVDLLTEVRSVYPSAHVFCVSWDNWGAAHEALVEEAIATSGIADVTHVDFAILQEEGLGCDYHTNTVTNARLGAELASTMGAVLGWQ